MRATPRSVVEPERFTKVAVAAAVASGLLLLLAAPPHGLWPIGLVALIPIAMAVRSASPARAFFLGWICGLVANLAGFRWLLSVLDHFGHVSPPVRALVLVVLSIYQGAVFGLWCGLGRLFECRARVPFIVAAPLAVAVVESVLPFVFPWHLAIVIWRAWPLIQLAELGGPVAVSAFVVLVNLVLATSFSVHLERIPGSRAARRGAIVAVALVALGLARAGHVSWRRSSAATIKVGIVQPNTGLLNADERKQHGDQHIALLRSVTGQLGKRGAALVVWPESSLPYLFDRELTREYARGHPWQLRGDFQGTLLFGALTHSFGRSVVKNSAVMVAPDGTVSGIYDKVDLLVFGEYVPLADRFPRWAASVRARLPNTPDIEPGAEPQVIASGGLRIAPFICYEDVLPSRLSNVGRAGPNLLVTLANHAWFGETGVAEQALALATFRSVETRRDLVRATMTGVSSIGDALGRVKARSGLHADPTTPETLLADVALIETWAMGPRVAPLFPWLCAVALVILAFLGITGKVAFKREKS